MNNKLVDQVMEEAKLWKRDKFHKSMLNWKETRRIDNGFSKAQKPWAVLYGKVRSSISYHYHNTLWHDMCHVRVLCIA